MAILGVWLSVLVIFFIMFMGYLEYELENTSRESTKYYRVKEVTRQIDLRLGSIDKGNLEENVIDWVHLSDGSDGEVKFLTSMKVDNDKYVQKYETEDKTDYGRYLDLIKATGFLWFILLIIALAVFCFYFGFKQWYIKVQKISDELLEKDLDLKKIELEKLRSELYKNRSYVLSVLNDTA